MECRVGEVRVGGGLYSANDYILVSPVPLEQRLLQAGDRGHLPALPQRAAAVDPGGRLPQGVLLGLRHGQQQGGLCLRHLDGEGRSPHRFKLPRPLLFTTVLLPATNKSNKSGNSKHL